MAEWQLWVADHSVPRVVPVARAQADSPVEDASAPAPTKRQALEPAALDEITEPAESEFASFTHTGIPYPSASDAIARAEAKIGPPVAEFRSVVPHSASAPECSTVEQVEPNPGSFASLGITCTPGEAGETLPAVSWVPTVESAFGGVFFLVNVALYLKLYGDFTCPLERGLELDIWDFLCLLGLDFVGDEIRDDFIFEIFATLAGRTKWQRPGAYFDPPRDWHLPSEWLEPFPEPFERKEVIHGGRLQVTHPAGFLLVDETCDVDSELADALSRWLGWVAGYIRARLARALGRDDAAEFLCRVPVRIAFTSTHVDVFYSLDQHPIEIRLAGLDRDPGWVPAAGRYVAYHFD
jgi:hypothetical protein